MDDLKADHSGGPIMKRMVLRTAIFGHGGGKGGVRLAATAAVEADMLRFGWPGYSQKNTMDTFQNFERLSRHLFGGSRGHQIISSARLFSARGLYCAWMC